MLRGTVYGVLQYLQTPDDSFACSGRGAPQLGHFKTTAPICQRAHWGISFPTASVLPTYPFSMNPAALPVSINTFV